MSHRVLLGFVLALTAAPARAQDVPPEKLLSPSTQLYVRWDGVTPHRAAYEASALGAALRGPTGDTVRTLLARAPKLLGGKLLAEPLLDGKPPAELAAVHADLKNAEKVVALLADAGVILAAEVNEPRPTLGGLGRAVTGLFTGNAPSPDGFLPDARVFVIVPDAGDRAEALFSSLRLFVRQDNGELRPLPAKLGRTGYEYLPKVNDAPAKLAWWLEGKHFVLYVGSASFETAIAGLAANAAKGGLTGHPLYQRCHKTGDFEAVARGYVDTAAVVGLAKRLAGPFVPGLAEKVDAVGVGNLKAVVFASGFKGKESRALYEFDLPGERVGFAKLVKRVPLALDDLPPLPPDVTRFSMLRVDFPAAYDAGLTAFDSFVTTPFGVEEAGKTPAEISKLRKDYLDRELTKAAGINVRDDLLPHLGDKVCLFQTPTEGLSVFGSVLCISVKDPAKVRTAADRLNRALDQLAGGGPMKVRKKVLAGVEMREVYGRGFGVVTPTYAVVGDWLVIAGHPQPVQGMILRHAGRLDRWKPDAATAARLAKMPADAVGIQYCNPKSTVQNLCVVGPLAIGTFGRFVRSGDEGEFDPPDIGLIPNAHELGRHLFPNLTYTRDDGRTVRVEVNDSFSLPLEFVGFEPFIVGMMTAAFRF